MALLVDPPYNTAMATAAYKSALQMAASLSRDEQLRLIHDLTRQTAKVPDTDEPTSVLELCGLGEEIWRQMDAQEYVSRERSSWNG
jgi:hypothetical protein